MSGLHDLSVWALNNTGFFSTTVAPTAEKRRGASERGGSAVSTARKAAATLGLELDKEEDAEDTYLWRRRSQDLHLVIGRGLKWEGSESLAPPKRRTAKGKHQKEDATKDDTDVLQSWLDWRPRYTYIQQLSRRIHVPYFLPLDCGVVSASDWGYSEAQPQRRERRHGHGKKRSSQFWSSEWNKVRSRTGVTADDVEDIERPTDYDRQLADVLATQAARAATLHLEEMRSLYPATPTPEPEKKHKTLAPPWLTRIVPLASGTKKQVLHRGFGPRRRRGEGSSRAFTVYSQSWSQHSVGAGPNGTALPLRFGRQLRQALVRPMPQLGREKSHGSLKGSAWYQMYQRSGPRSKRSESGGSANSDPSNQGEHVLRPNKLHLIENYTSTRFASAAASMGVVAVSSPREGTHHGHFHDRLDPTSPTMRRTLMHWSAVWNRRLGNPRAATAALAAAAAASAAMRPSLSQRRHLLQFENSGGLYAELFGFEAQGSATNLEEDAWGTLQSPTTIQQRVNASRTYTSQHVNERQKNVTSFDPVKKHCVELLKMNTFSQVRDPLVAARLAGLYSYVVCVGDGVHPRIEAERSVGAVPQPVDALLREVLYFDLAMLSLILHCFPATPPPLCLIGSTVTWVSRRLELLQCSRSCHVRHTGSSCQLLPPRLRARLPCTSHRHPYTIPAIPASMWQRARLLPPLCTWTCL